MHHAAYIEIDRRGRPGEVNIIPFTAITRIVTFSHGAQVFIVDGTAFVVGQETAEKLVREYKWWLESRYGVPEQY